LFAARDSAEIAEAMRFLRLLLPLLLLCLGPQALAQQLYYIHTDHLNTPRMVTDGAGTAVWRWDQVEPFGDNPPDEDPDGNGGLWHMPLRFPGQYFDKETNLHYNYFRDYDPGIGRYVQSDPIGLRAALNTYAYVHGRPLSLIDPRGLAAGDAAGRSIIQQIIDEITSTPGKVAGNACAAKVLCDYYRRFPYQSVFEQCRVLEFELQGKWVRECEDVCSDLLRKKCNPPQSCGPNDTASI